MNQCLEYVNKICEARIYPKTMTIIIKRVLSQ